MGRLSIAAGTRGGLTPSIARAVPSPLGPDAAGGALAPAIAVIWCIIWANWVALDSATSRARAKLSARCAPPTPRRKR